MLRSLCHQAHARVRAEPALMSSVLLGVVLVAVATVAAPARALPRRSAATARLTFVDLATDKVSPGTNPVPDRRPDGHFRLEVTGTGTINGITVRTADASGKPCCSQTWNTTPNDGLWVLGVFRNGTQLNPTDRPVSIPVDGSVTLDLYASDSGYFTLGQRLRVDATLTGGGTVSSVAPPITSLGAGGAGGGGGGTGGGGDTTTTTTTPGGTQATPPTATSTGTVTVNGVPFTGGTVPFGATVDVTDGAITLTSSVGTLKVTGQGGGVTAAFKLVRGTDQGRPVELRLVKGDFGVCRHARAHRVTKAAAKIVRSIWGDGKGQFRTRGRYAAATVRGTRWQTSDRCDGTNVKVARGVVQVADFPQRRQVTVRAGRSYLARP